jgi:monoterpene epsilon-lactone hydrolase
VTSTAYIDTVLLELKAMLENSSPTIDGLRGGWDHALETVISAVTASPAVDRQPVDAGGVPGAWFRTPSAIEGRAVLFLHGGGYVFGSIDSYRDLISRLADACRARVLAIDYRLAPECPFPAGLDDAVLAYRWLLSQGYDPSRVAIVGDSAGGGLTLATLTRLGERADAPMPAAAATISAWVDFEALGESMKTCASADPFIQREVVLAVAQMYLPGGGDPREASPLYADLSKLPPMLMIAGGGEVLCDDTRRMAAAARSQGVEVTERIYDGSYHDFPLFEPTSVAGSDAIGEIATFLDARLASTSA